MDIRRILAKTDHSLLAVDADWSAVRQLCDEALAFHTASVCIPPSFVSQAAGYLQKKIPVCTVIGFPNGYSTTRSKCFEAEDALACGADELDMVINIGWLKEGKDSLVAEQIRLLKEICKTKILKVIVETCLLTQEEKIRACQIVTETGADYIKTSTGFSTGGATAEDIRLFAAHVGPDVKIKAAGGISTLDDAALFLSLGAARLGSSRIIRLAKESGFSEGETQ